MTTKTKKKPSPPGYLRIILNPEIRAAIDEWCSENGVGISELMRESALERIGRPDLIGSMTPRGRPRKQA